jgi:hypothetical protein
MSDDDGGKSSSVPGAPPSRDAQLPHAPPASQAGSSPDRRTSSGTVLMKGSSESRASGPTAEGRSSEPARTSRGTLLMSRPPSGTRRSRTTIMEVNEIAQRLSILRPAAGSDSQNPLRQMAISFAMSVTVVTLLAMMFAGGAFRLVLGVLAATGGTTLGVWFALRSLPRLAKRMGARELPGTPLLWVGGFLVLVVSATAGITWGVSEASKPLVKLVVPKPPPAPSAAPTAEPPPEPEETQRADEKVKPGSRVVMDDGVLYVPPAFRSEDGRFDLVIHYHGNPEMVERSLDRAGVNAIAQIINYGDGSGRYSEPLRNPQAFDTALERIEQRVAEKFGLKSPRIRRVTLSSWSAGFGAVYHILASRSRLDRVDALLMMDSMHASYAPGGETKLTDLSLKPFVHFGRRAMAGEKLMVLTHSAIETQGYPSTTRSADGLLETLGLERRSAAPDAASPAPVELDVMLKAFPSGERNWMRVTSVTEEGSLVVMGCTGKGKGDHIAHLAQSSVTVFARLVDRWKAPAGSN